MPKDITVEIADRVAEVTLNRPQACNALSACLTGELSEALDGLEADDSVKVVLLAGAGPHFCAGADVREMLDMTAAEALTGDFAGCCTRLASFAKPVVAAIRGVALGGGCELVEMCDVVVAAESARFGHPEITLGTMPGAGGTQRLTRALGKALAMDLLLTGRLLSAAEAQGAGLVSRVVADDQVLDEARAVARRIAGTSAPVARLIKRAVHAAAGEGDGLTLERGLFHLTFALHDRRAGMAAFLERRPAEFEDR